MGDNIPPNAPEFSCSMGDIAIFERKSANLQVYFWSWLILQSHHNKHILLQLKACPPQLEIITFPVEMSPKNQALVGFLKDDAYIPPHVTAGIV